MSDRQREVDDEIRRIVGCTPEKLLPRTPVGSWPKVVDRAADIRRRRRIQTGLAICGVAASCLAGLANIVRRARSGGAGA